MGENRLAIGGTSHPWGKDIGRQKSPTAEARILLSHSPDEVYKAAGWGIDLVLSGHVHGGQVRLPVIGPILAPSRFSRRFDRGFFRIGRTLMFVSQGIGAKDPIRVGCHPEVTRFVLRSRKATSESFMDDSNDAIAEVAVS